MSLTIITCNWKFGQAGWRAPSLVLHVSHFNVILKCHQPGKSHPWPVKPCWPQCQRRDCRRGLFSTVHEGRWDYCGHNVAGAGFFYGKNNINLMCKMHTALCQSIQRIAGCWVWNGVVPFMSIWSCLRHQASSSVSKHNLDRSVDCSYNLCIPSIQTNKKGRRCA